MWLAALLGLLVGLLVWKLCTKKTSRRSLEHIPGPAEHPLMTLLSRNRPDPTKLHLYLAKHAKTYGPLMRLRQLNGASFLVANDYQSIHEVLVKYGKEAGGRPRGRFRIESYFQNTGISGNLFPDAKWKLLRKITHGHVRQFGDGLSRLEININTIAETMLERFDEACGISFDPFQTIHQASLETIIFLMTGDRLSLNNPLMKRIKQYGDMVNAFISPSVPTNLLLLDIFPWLKHFKWTGSEIPKKIANFEEEIWASLEEANMNKDESETIIRKFQSYMKSQVSGEDGMCLSDVSDGDEGKNSITQLDAIKTTLILLLAGEGTTKGTFYGGLNLLAHHPHVQEKVFTEIQDVVGNRNFMLSDRSNMPYTFASILEIQRYVSVAAFTAHKTCSDISVIGYDVPKKTSIVINLWNMHWNADFWGDPEVFRPERFLDEDGAVIPVDHPRRKHLIPFGAGTRVCVGETLAISRLFLWIASTIQRFSITPGIDNDKSKIDPNNYICGLILMSPNYNIIFNQR